MMLKRKMKLKAAYFPPTSRAVAMSNAPQGDYQSISVMDRRIVPGSKFFVEVAGTTKGAHKKIVSDFERWGYVQVSPEQSDFVLIFCPVVSRVGTDITAALQNVSECNKPKVLVVMHHTFDASTVVAESRRQVEGGNVVLTVDYLFHEGKLLTCDRNNIAWDQICRYLEIPTAQPSFWNTTFNYVYSNKWCFIFGTFAVIGTIVIIYYLAVNLQSKKNVSLEYPLK